MYTYITRDKSYGAPLSALEVTVSNHEAEVTVEMPFNEGYADSGWSQYELKGNQPIASDYASPIATELTSGRVFRAVYTAGAQVYFSANGGSGAPERLVVDVYTNTGDAEKGGNKMATGDIYANRNTTDFDMVPAKEEYAVN